jgi:thiol-disulfide isomerase/thioredoxin
MKKLSLLTLFVATIMAVSSCKKEENPPSPGNNPPAIAQEQKTVIFYLSGNWCGPCGLYGKPALANVEQKNANKLIIIAGHVNGSGTDPYNNADANALLTAWNITGVPTAAIGGGGTPAQKVSGGPSMQSTMETKINSVLGTAATANSSIDVTLNGSILTVKANTKFFTASSETHYISAYVVENGLKGRQYISGQGWDENATHNHVLRTKLSTSITGDELTTSATAGQEISKEFTTTLNSAWKTENLQVAVVIWKAGTNGRIVINGTIKNVK